MDLAGAGGCTISGSGAGGSADEIADVEDFDELVFGGVEVFLGGDGDDAVVDGVGERGFVGAGLGEDGGEGLAEWNVLDRNGNGRVALDSGILKGSPVDEDVRSHVVAQEVDGLFERLLISRHLFEIFFEAVTCGAVYCIQSSLVILIVCQFGPARHAKTHYIGVGGKVFSGAGVWLRAIFCL